MKKLIFVFLIFPTILFAQRVKDLTTQPTYDGSAYTILDKAGYTSSKKISLSILTGAEALLRSHNDTLTRRAVGLSYAGAYVPDATTHYLTGATTVMNALHKADSMIYKQSTTTLLLDTGATHNSIIIKSMSNTAAGSGGMAINSYNNALGLNSLAMGKYAVTQRHFSQCGANYKFSHAGDAQGMSYVMEAQTTGSATDTFKIARLYFPVMATDQVSRFLVDVVAVIDSAKSPDPGKGFSQLWQFTVTNDAGTTTLIGTADSSTAKRSTSFNPTMSLTVNSATKAVWLFVHGVDYDKIKWVANVRETTVGYRNFNLGY